MVYYYCKGRPPKGEKDMKKIEKMTYAQASAYLKELKQQAIQRAVEKTLDFFKEKNMALEDFRNNTNYFFKESVKEPLTFRELVNLGFNEFETAQSFSNFVYSNIKDIDILTKPTYAIACDKNGVPYKDAQPIGQSRINAYILGTNNTKEDIDEWEEDMDDDDWDEDEE